MKSYTPTKREFSKDRYLLVAYSLKIKSKNRGLKILGNIKMTKTDSNKKFSVFAFQKYKLKI